MNLIKYRNSGDFTSPGTLKNRRINVIFHHDKPFLGEDTGVFKFIHSADLHLGSAFSAWCKQRPEAAKELMLAPCAALDRLVDAAIAEKVLFAVVAGDVFDTPTPPLSAEAHFRAALEKLDAAGIRVFVALGNHDCGAHLVDLPANTVLFSGERAEAFEVKFDGRTVATVAGISHSGPAEKRDLSPQVEAALSAASGFRIGVLHANVDGDPGYEPYAPVALDTLRRGRADYWALGHVHKRRILCDRPRIVYSGSVQGRSVNEPGERGGFLVEVGDDGGVKCTELNVQSVRFETLTLDRLEDVADLPALKRRFGEALPESAGPLCLRLVLASGTPLNPRLRSSGQEELTGIFSPELAKRLPGAWLESVIVRTTAPVSPARREGLAAEVAAVHDEVDFKKLLAELSFAADERVVFGDEELDEIAAAAEDLLLDALSGDTGGLK